eukprot:3072244-Prymnesium_polylepis.1
MKQKTPTVLSFARAATEGRLARGSTMTRSKRAGAGLDCARVDTGGGRQPRWRWRRRPSEEKGGGGGGGGKGREGQPRWRRRRRPSEEKGGGGQAAY